MRTIIVMVILAVASCNTPSDQGIQKNELIGRWVASHQVLDSCLGGPNLTMIPDTGIYTKTYTITLDSIQICTGISHGSGCAAVPIPWQLCLFHSWSLEHDRILVYSQPDSSGHSTVTTYLVTRLDSERFIFSDGTQADTCRNPPHVAL
jgi:hypothetical protein